MTLWEMSAGVDWVGLKEVTTSGTRWMCVCMKQNVSIPLKSGEQIFYFPASSFLRFILGAYRIRGLVVFLGYSIQTRRTVVYIQNIEFRMKKMNASSFKYFIFESLWIASRTGLHLRHTQHLAISTDYFEWYATFFYESGPNNRV